jgi:Tol biopolymer transport system component
MTPPTRVAALLLALPCAAIAQNVAEVQVAPPALTLRVGERSGLLATAFDRAGNVIPTVRVLWSSNNILVARVDNNGIVTGVSNGVAVVEGRVGQRKGSAAVQVVGGPQVAPPTPVTPAGDATLAGQPPGTGPATVLRIEPPSIYLLPSENVRAWPRPLKDDGSPAAPVAVTWKSFRPDIATVDPNGVVIALAVGQATVQATGANGVTATAPVVVQQADFAVLEPAPIALGPGEMDTVHVMVPTQGGRRVSPLALQWTTSDPNIVRVSLTGVVTAVNPGRATLAVSGLLQTKSVDVVVHRPVTLLAVRPRWQDEVLVPVRGTTKFEAQALGTDKTPVPEAPLSWSVADTSIARVDPATAVLTGVSAGKTQLVVKGPGQGLSVSWNVRVVDGAVKLSATRIGLSLGRRYVLKGNFTDSAGTVIGAATGLTWASDSSQVVTVSDDGTITAVSHGHGRVTATAPGGKTATVDVFVQGDFLVASSRSGPFQLYVGERSNLAQLHRLVPDSASDPAFSPDGSRIAFTSTTLHGGRRDIAVMDADGTNVTRLANSPGSESRAQFTPDGNSVVFQSDRTGHSQLYTQPITGSVAVQLTQEPGANTLPAVSPDGETIAFVSTRDGATNIWLMAKDGSNQRPFTRTAGSSRSTAPHFLRDGWLVYLVETKAGGRTTTQVVKADLPTGRVTSLTTTDLLITDCAVNAAGDLLALVVNVQAGGKPFYKVYVQPVGTAGGAIPVPTTGSEQMVTPAFMP